MAEGDGSGGGGGEAAAFATYPRQYVARRGTPSAIDGDIFKAEWERAPWSEPFTEIRGPQDRPPSTEPTEAQATRMKMLWDDEYLYIAAIIDLAAGEELVAKFTERNTPIFHTDSDFEVFLDPAGCCHGYKELELNAINTVWNLMLTKPYSNGGKELSGRVAEPGEADYWDVQAQKTATKITRGAVQRGEEPSQWCCELAMAHADTIAVTPVHVPQPANGQHWRINFSRVEKKGEVNWVWSPQVVWSPAERRHAGQVNMHLPDAWGYVLFADAEGEIPGGLRAEDWRDPAWPARAAAHAVYYAAKAFEAKHQAAPTSVEDLGSEGLLEGVLSDGARVELRPAEVDGAWTATATVQGWEASITSERLLKVQKS